jgi:hypothetical protein
MNLVVVLVDGLQGVVRVAMHMAVTIWYLLFPERSTNE